MPKYSVDWARASPFTPKIANSSPVSNIQISKTECIKLGDYLVYEFLYMLFVTIITPKVKENVSVKISHRCVRGFPS